MNSEHLNDFCSRWLNAWTGNRPEKLIQFYSDDTYYRDPARADGIRGKKPLFEYFSKLLSKNPDWVWTAKEIIPTAKGFVFVTTSSNARSPYSGYLQYLIFSDIEVPQQSMREWSKKGFQDFWFLQKKTVWDLEWRFEFDIGPSGLELERALNRSQGEKEWKVSSSLSLPECPPPGRYPAVEGH